MLRPRIRLKREVIQIFPVRSGGENEDLQVFNIIPSD